MFFLFQNALLIIIVPPQANALVFFVPAFEHKIYSLMLYHLLKSTLHSNANVCNIGTFIRLYMQSTLHSKANACNRGTFIRFYMQSTLHSIANACNIGTFIRFYNQMRVEKQTKHLPIDSIGHSHNCVSQSLPIISHFFCVNVFLSKNNKIIPRIF